ncbi:hypothetical protein Bhyg_02335 [Pseudolycoriella hygida]|uniref:Uncharacterized protein n=1 Tax=Pseudolycoriella hygida TaxID=35572 RepID=A0A9Q0NB70_9DIPT|nr:hypothetical protein Bhyg_02335 [Pseudolycoriella hygida]
MNMSMESVGQVVVPLRIGGKKMRKRRELDALVAHSLAKRACSSTSKRQPSNGINSQDQLLSQSTSDQEDSTWSKAPMSTRCRTKRYSCFRTCGPLVFILIIVMLFGFMYWLYFDLRQQLSEHRMKIEQVSACNQLLPDALQQWHESSKWLEKNQSAINSKFIEVQTQLDNIEKELTQFKESVHKKDAESEKDNLLVLQTNVATFGAKIQDLSVGVDQLKERLREVQKNSFENKENLTRLMTNFNAMTKNQTSSLIGLSNSVNTTNMLNNISQFFTYEIKNLSLQLSTVNNTLSQKAKGLEEDFRSQKPKLDALIENFANMSSHVTSIENDWTKYKQTALDFEENSMKINAEIIFLKNNTERIASSVNDIQAENRRRQTLARVQENVFQQLKNDHVVLPPVKQEVNSSTTAKATTTETPFIPIVNATNLSILLNASAVDSNSTDSIMLKGL